MSNDSWEYDVGLTNTPPRRRTEPAITVAPDSWSTLAVGDRVGLPDKCFEREGTVTRVDFGSISVVFDDAQGVSDIYSWHSVRTWLRHIEPQSSAFAPSEVEAIVTWGSDAYCSQAMVCDEARERAEEDERKRVYGPTIGYRLDSDWQGENEEGIRRRNEEWDARKRAWRQGFSKPLPFETPGDYALRHGIAHVYGERDDFFERVRLEMAAVERGEPVTP
jgi:hypothetical protein